jgi:translation initiation factor IF-2
LLITRLLLLSLIYLFLTMVTKKNLTSSRPPVVTLMGHIDHGKTSLLDYIRKSHLQSKETGGITQHIGAYQVSVNGQKITFIDTPGHKVFEKMRERGAQVTDLVVLVIAADEGVKSQTEECLNHIKEAGVPFLIALNKIDLPNVNQEEIKNKLMRYGVVTEDRGGDIVIVPVSAKTGQGVDGLLEMIILVAQMSELKYSPRAPFSGVVIESWLDRQRGVLAAIIVKQGQLLAGQEIVSGEGKIKVKALFDDQGEKIGQAIVSQPVSVLGFSHLLPAGSLVYDAASKVTKPASLEEKSPVNYGQEGLIKLVVKADTQGTLEALLNSLPKEDLAIVKTGVGDISESDVFFATSTGAEIIGFNVRVSRLVMDLAESEKVSINLEEVIYYLIQSIEEKIKAKKVIEEEKQLLGEAQIIADFIVPDGRVAGAKVTSGVISKGAEVSVIRSGDWERRTRIISLKRGKEDIIQAKKGQDFGAIFLPQVDFNIGDVIKCHRLKQ